jgi:protein-S-isoprenylcysteine O-methyltransferase Ste14
METRDDAAPVRIPPPLVFLGALILGGLWHVQVIPFPIELSLGVRLVIATVLGLAGLALIAGALRLFRETGQDPKPWETTPSICATGVYRVSRNPMYVGMACIQASIGVGWGNGWILALLPVSIVFVYAIAIRHEEEYLEAKFGEEYRAYKRSVRRWL